MSLVTDGYLSPDIGSWMASHRRQNPEWFGLTDRMNRICQQVMLSCSVPDSDNRALLVMLLFARALSSFQGAALMIERGMSVEALTLTRSCLETSFYLAAIVRDPASIEGLIGADAKHKRTTARWLTGPGAAAAGLPPEQIETLRELLLQDTPEATPLKIQTAAQLADMSEIYETVYRDLCDRAAHPSLNSLLRHVTEDTNGNVDGLRFGPEATQTREAILAMLTALFPSTYGVTKIFPIKDDYVEELNACWEVYVQLMGDQGER